MESVIDQSAGGGGDRGIGMLANSGGCSNQVVHDWCSADCSIAVATHSIKDVLNFISVQETN